MSYQQLNKFIVKKHLKLKCKIKMEFFIIYCV